MIAMPVSPPRTSLLALATALLVAGAGCDRPSVPSQGNLPPAYTRDKIVDPALAEAAWAFIAWAGEQKVDSQALFTSVTVLPPAPTLLPYVIGNYQKENRLPAIMITTRLAVFLATTAGSRRA